MFGGSDIAFDFTEHVTSMFGLSRFRARSESFGLPGSVSNDEHSAETSCHYSAFGLTGMVKLLEP